MLTYRNSNITFSALLIALIAGDSILFIHPLVYAAVIASYIAVIAWGTSVITSGFYLKTYCSGNPGLKTIALTFDDGPDRKVTPAVLDILKNHNIKAAFFCIGEKIDKDPELARRISDEGHIIGNHSYTHHFFFDLFRKKKMKEEILNTASAIRNATGNEIRFFRPPYGVINPPLAAVIEACDYRVIGWSLRSKDTVTRDKEQLMKRLSSNLKNGDIVLFHDRLDHTTDVLEKFIKMAKNRGFSFERPDLLLNLN